jgi:hypothetical protein
MHHSPLGNTCANEGRSLAFGMEHGWNRVPAALANDYNDLALAALIALQTTVATVFFLIGGLRTVVRYAGPGSSPAALS